MTDSGPPSAAGRLLSNLAPLLALARRGRVQKTIAVAIFGVSIAGIALLIYQHRDQLSAAQWRLEPIRLIAGLIFQASTVAIATWLWMDMSAQLGAGWNPRRDSRVYAYSLMARRLPGAVWHVVGRAAYYREAGLGRRVGVVGSLIEAGLLVLTGTALAGIAFRELQPIGSVVGLLALAIGPLIVRPVVRLALRVPVEALPPVNRIYVWMLLDIAAWLLGCTGVFLQFDALYPLDPSAWRQVVAATTSSIVVSSAVVFLPGGLGLRELGLTGLLADVIPAGVAAALAVAFRISIAAVEVLWALLVIALVRPPAQDAAETPQPR